MSFPREYAFPVPPDYRREAAPSRLATELHHHAHQGNPAPYRRGELAHRMAWAPLAETRRPESPSGRNMLATEPEED